MEKKAKSQSPGFIWKFAELQRPWWIQILSIIGFLLMFEVLFGSWHTSVIFVLCMYLHEKSHDYYFKKYGIRSETLFIFPLGAVAKPINLEENRKSDQLHLNELSFFVQAGPFINVLLLSVGVLMVQLSHNPFLLQVGSDLVYANLVFCLFNLIPAKNLDSGYLMFFIVSSLDKRFRLGMFAAIFTAITLVFAIYIDPGNFSAWQLALQSIMLNFPVTLPVFVLSISLFKRFITHQQLIQIQPSQYLSPKQASFHMGVYSLQIFVAIGFFALGV